MTCFGSQKKKNEKCKVTLTKIKRIITLNEKSTGQNKREDIENRISSLRKTKQMKQQDLSNEVQVYRQLIVAIEKGKYNPSLELAFKISRVFQASIEEVFIFNE